MRIMYLYIYTMYSMCVIYSLVSITQVVVYHHHHHRTTTTKSGSKKTHICTGTHTHPKKYLYRHHSCHIYAYIYMCIYTYVVRPYIELRKSLSLDVVRWRGTPFPHSHRLMPSVLRRICRHHRRICSSNSISFSLLAAPAPRPPRSAPT